MRRMRALIVVRFVISASLLAAQEPQIGVTRLHLGQPKQEVLALLRRAYRVDSLPYQTDFSAVKDSVGGQYVLLGRVFFISGATTHIERDWDLGNATVNSAGRAVTAALAGLSGQTNCTVLNQDFSGSTMSGRVETIRCGAHEVGISSVQGSAEYEPLGVVEVWSSPGSSTRRP